MALTQDQRAMLQLVLERGQSYDELASLLGVDLDSVRSRARAALTELGGRDPDADVGLTDYLLGQADPIGRADAVRHLQRDPEALELASELITKLQAIAPEAELPSLPGAGRRSRGAAAAPRPAAGSGGASKLSPPSRRQAQLLAGIAAALVIAVVVALAAFGGLSSDGGEAASPSGATDSADDEILTRVELEPQGGSSGSGRATFGVANGQQPYVELRLSGLQPAPSGQTYVLWLLLNEGRGNPLTPLTVSEQGEADERLPLDDFTIPVAAATRVVAVSLSDDRELAQVVQDAAQQANPVIRFTGRDILRGDVPLSDRAAAELPEQGGAGSGGGSADGG